MCLQSLEYLLNTCAKLDTRLHPVLDPEVGSILVYEYSVTCGAAKAAWYIPCVRWILGGASERGVDGRVRWLVGWVFVRGFSGCKSGNCMKMGSHDGILIGQ